MGLLTIALLIDIFVGDPDWLWRRVPHPVVLIGNLIDWFDKLREREQFSSVAQKIGLASANTANMALGAVMLVVMLVIALVVSSVIEMLGGIGWVIELATVAVLVAQKSLYDHVARVAKALRLEGLQGGR